MVCPSHVLVGILLRPLRLVHPILAAGAEVVDVARLESKHKPRDPPDRKHRVLAFNLGTESTEGALHCIAREGMIEKPKKKTKPV